MRGEGIGLAGAPREERRGGEVVERAGRRFKTGQTLNSKTTVGDWLDTWLAGRKRLRVTGLKRYACDVRVHLKPHLGSIRLDKLRVHHLNTMFDAINERIARWQETGVRPSPVMVWSPEQTGRFLDFVTGDRLYPLWRLISFRGTRRGESCGVRWEDLSAAEHSLAISTQLVQDGWEIHEGTPKTDSGIRLIALDEETFEVLQAHRLRQEREREEWGDGWQNTGRIFAQEDGSLLHPGKVSDLFERLVAAAGLPPIRLHDLRHVAATLMLAAGVDVKVVSETLGRSDTHITCDIYQSVLDDLARDAAEKVVKLVPRTRSHLVAIPDKQSPDCFPCPAEDATPEAPLGQGREGHRLRTAVRRGSGQRVSDRSLRLSLACSCAA